MTPELSQELEVARRLRECLSHDAAGRALLEATVSGSAPASFGLADWLQVHSSEAPSPLTTYVTGGQIQKLVNIGRAGLVLIQQHDAARASRKRWRRLSHVTLTAPADTEAARRAYLGDMALCLSQVFYAQGFTRFTAMWRAGTRQELGVEIAAYELECTYPAFCEALRQRAVQRLKEVMGIPTGDQAALARWKERAAAEWGEFAARWTVEVDAAVSSDWVALELTLDLDSGLIRIHSPEPSVDPASYGNHVRTTSELLCYLCSLHHRPVAYVGDLAWYGGNYPLLKLLTAFMDKVFDPEKIQVNVDDPEEWDYLYPELDEEMGRYST